MANETMGDSSDDENESQRPKFDFDQSPVKAERVDLLCEDHYDEIKQTKSFTGQRFDFRNWKINPEGQHI